MFPRFLTIVLKPIDNICNLRCEYCYAKTEFKGYSKASLNSKLLAWEWFPVLIKKLNLCSELQRINFVWQGGEPLLLPKPLFKKAVYWQKSLMRKNIRWENAVQTNGLLLDSKYADFLISLGMNLGISIDGPEFKHNRMRFASYKVFEEILNNIRNLSYQKVSYSLFFVIHEDNWKDAESIFDFIVRMNPQNGVALPPRFTNEKSFLDPSYYSNFLIHLFDLWWANKPVYISTFEHILEGLAYKVPSLCYLAGKCNSFIAIDFKGDVYSTCEIHNNLNIGNILQDSIDTIKNRHGKKIAECMKRFTNKSLFEMLKSDIKYIYFQGKGCPNRLVEGEDPFVFALAEVISYINKVVNK